MPRKPAAPPDDPEESQRFLDTAREVDASEDPEDFDEAFKKVARPAPKADLRQKK
jgi:hypothetical protein